MRTPVAFRRVRQAALRAIRESEASQERAEALLADATNIAQRMRAAEQKNGFARAIEHQFHRGRRV